MPGLHRAKPTPLGVCQGEKKGGADHAAAGHDHADIAKPMALRPLLPAMRARLHGEEKPLESNAKQDEYWFVVVCSSNKECRVLPKEQGVAFALTGLLGGCQKVI
jgi:hypothetical protein